MNLGFDFRRGEEALPATLDKMTARINTIFAREHDPNTGAHTDLTATSLAVDGPITADSIEADSLKVDTIEADALNVNHITAVSLAVSGHGSFGSLAVSGAGSFGSLDIAGDVVVNTLRAKTSISIDGTLTTQLGQIAVWGRASDQVAEVQYRTSAGVQTASVYAVPNELQAYVPAGTIKLRVGATATLNFNGSNWYPGSDLGASLGFSAGRWNEAWVNTIVAGSVSASTGHIFNQSAGWGMTWDGSSVDIKTNSGLTKMSLFNDRAQFTHPIVLPGGGTSSALTLQYATADTGMYSGQTHTLGLVVRGSLGTGAGGSTQIAMGTTPAARAITIIADDMRPFPDNYINLGIVTQRWKNVYAWKFSGPGLQLIDGSGVNKAYIEGTDGTIHFKEIIGLNGGGEIIYGNRNLYPSTDSVDVNNGSSLGWNGGRWRDLWAVNGTIQTSDARLKELEPNPFGLAFIRELPTYAYRWRSDTSRRQHYGVTAQDLDAMGFDALYQSDFDELPAGLNYCELIAPIIRAIQELDKQVNAHPHV
jgi:hypothetical protein